MKPSERLGVARLPGGGELVLERRPDGHFRLALAGHTLMASDQHASEEALATLALDRLAARGSPPRRLLLGGLGMGFTLRAALDGLQGSGAPAVEIQVAELLPEVVDWCRGPLAPLSRDALADPRVRVEVADVADVVRRSRVRFDAILLDVDNGPRWESQRRNQVLYSEPGLRLLKGALASGGVLAVWSAEAAPADFPRRLERTGFAVEVESARSRDAGRGSHHTIYLATIPSSALAPAARAAHRKAGEVDDT